MTVAEILSELSKLQPDERELVEKKLCELEMEDVRQWLQRRESDPSSPENHWIHAFDEFRDSMPDRSEDLAVSRDCRLYGAPKRW